MKLEGIIVPVVTPLTGEGEIDKKGIKSVIRYILESEVNGIFILGSTGEFPALTDDEKQKVVEIGVEEVNGRVPVLVGVSSTSIKKAIEYAKMAEKLKADAVVAVSPYYYPFNGRAELVAYFKSLIDHSHLPLFLYNIPQFTKTFINLELVEELTQYGSIAGIKDSSNDFTFFQRLIQKVKKKKYADFSVLQGNESLLLPSLLMGADGGVHALANVAPKLLVAQYNAAKSGDIQTCLKLQEKILSLYRLQEISYSVSAIKMALNLLGICSATASKPFQPLTLETKGLIKGVLKEIGLIS